MNDMRLDVDTHWEVIGQGDRPAIAIHCMLGSSRMWRPIFEPLGDQLSTTIFDLPGHGKSGAWEGGDPGSYQRLAAQIAGSFIERPVDLIGHSFGAGVALRIAVAAPEAVRSLTLIEPVIFRAIEGTHECDAVRHEQNTLQRLMSAGDWDEAARGFVEKWGLGMAWDDLSQQMRDRFARQMPIVANAAQANFDDPADSLRDGGLESIDAPVLLVHGANTEPSVPLVCAELAVRLQDVGTATVPDAGHMMPVTHASTLAELIGMNIERS